MLFGLFDNRRALAAAWRYCEPIFSSLGNSETERLMPTAFEDAYVLGFLQPIVIEAVNEDAGKAVKTETWLRATTRVVDRLAPGSATKTMEAIVALANPQHPKHSEYLAGQREGNAYAIALHTRNEEQAERVMAGFRGYVTRTYLR